MTYCFLVHSTANVTSTLYVVATDFGEDKRSKVAAKVAEKLDEAAAKGERASAKKLDEAAAKRERTAAKRRAAAKQERVAAKYERKAEQWMQHAEAIEEETYARVAAGLAALDVWTRGAGQVRRPRFTREEIAATAMRLADTEGFEAVSMRRIAAELGAGTMTLYHYVQTKDELLTLLTDAVMGEVVVPDGVEFPTGWRAALTLIADRARGAFVRHAWMLDITDDPPLGPNSVRHFDQTLQAVASLDASLRERLDVVTAVDEYVFGYCLHERNRLQTAGEPTFDPGLMAYVDSLIRTGDYPQLALLTNELGLELAWGEIEAAMHDPGRFHRNLARLLDGIAADLEGARPKRR
jgi:AcrR family transcriptional regulator